MSAKRRIEDISNISNISTGPEDEQPDAEPLPTLSSLSPPPPPSSSSSSLSSSFSSLSLSTSTPASAFASANEGKVESGPRSKMARIDKVDEVESKRPTLLLLPEKVFVSISDFVRDGKMMVPVPADFRQNQSDLQKIEKIEKIHKLWTSATEHLVYQDAATGNKVRIERIGKAGVEAVLTYIDSNSSSSSSSCEVKSIQNYARPGLVAFRDANEVNLHLVDSATHVEIFFRDLPLDFQQQLNAEIDFNDLNRFGAIGFDAPVSCDIIWNAWLSSIANRKLVHDNLPHTCALEVAKQMLAHDPVLMTEARRLFADDWRKGDALKFYDEIDRTINGTELICGATQNVTLVRREEILIPVTCKVYSHSNSSNGNNNNERDSSCVPAMSLGVRSDKARAKDQNGAWILVYNEHYKAQDFPIGMVYKRGAKDSKDEGKIVVDKVRKLPRNSNPPHSPFVPGQKLPFTGVVDNTNFSSSNGGVSNTKCVERRVTLSVDDLYKLVK